MTRNPPRSRDDDPGAWRLVGVIWQVEGLIDIDYIVEMRRTPEHDELRWRMDPDPIGTLRRPRSRGTDHDAARELLLAAVSAQQLRPGGVLTPGLLTAADVDAVVEEYWAPRLALREKERLRRSVINDLARDLGLDPQPTGHAPGAWQAACPGYPSHPIHLVPVEERFFCGWCHRHGGPDELRSLAAERRRSTPTQQPRPGPADVTDPPV